MNTSEIEKVIRKYRKKLLLIDGVEDVGFGYKESNGKLTEALCISILVDFKLDNMDLSKEQIIPQEIEGFPTDIIETCNFREDVISNPIQGGVYIRNARRKGYGTLGCIVIDKITGEAMGLTNHHVLINYGINHGKKGDFVLQPQNSPNNPLFQIGRVNRYDSRVDACLFTINLNLRKVDLNSNIESFNERIENIHQPILGLSLKKNGGTTGVTFGIISQIYAKKFLISPNKQKPAVNNEISMGGDSGSIWLSDTNSGVSAIGLHFAGEKNNRSNNRRNVEYAFAYKLDLVSKYLNFRV